MTGSGTIRDLNHRLAERIAELARGLAGDQPQRRHVAVPRQGQPRGRRQRAEARRLA
jgi:hypothetical protein